MKKVSKNDSTAKRIEDELGVKMYNKDEMIALLGITERTLLRWITDGKLKGAVKMGKTWHIEQEKLKSFLKGE